MGIILHNVFHREIAEYADKFEWIRFIYFFQTGFTGLTGLLLVFFSFRKEETKQINIIAGGCRKKRFLSAEDGFKFYHFRPESGQNRKLSCRSCKSCLIFLMDFISRILKERNRRHKEGKKR
jgi:hypothetical protein